MRNTDALFLGAEFVASAATFGAFHFGGEAASACGWCETNGFDRSARRLLKLEESRAPALLSDVTSVAIGPLALAGLIAPALASEQDRFALQDTVMVLNAFLLTTGIGDGVKKLSDRERPAFHYGREHETPYSDNPDQQYVSFFSGHTARAFSLASSATTLAYLRGYWTAPYLAVGGGALALGTGVLRIAADVHWASDVLVGAAAGTAVGFGLPFLLHSRRTAHGSITVLPSLSSQHAMLIVSGEF